MGLRRLCLNSFRGPKGQTIKLHVYRPIKMTEPTPVLINFRGSDFAMPTHGTKDLFCYRIFGGNNCLCKVLDVQCRLAPENLLRHCDAEDTINWILK